MSKNYTDEQFQQAVRATGLLSLRDVINRTGISPKTLAKHMREGLVTGHRRVVLGRAMWLFAPEAVTAYAATVADINNEARAGGQYRAGIRRPQAPDGYMSIQTLSTMSGWSEYFIHDRIKDGSLQTQRGAGNTHLISQADAERFIATYRDALEQRKKAGYKGPPDRSIKWTPDMLAKLGTAADTQLAQEFGISVASVRTKRLNANIPAYFPQGPDIVWTPEMDAQLGTDTDTAVAAKLNINIRAVRRRRSALGIKPYEVDQAYLGVRYDWQPEDDALLGSAPDAEVAKRLGLHPSSVFNRRKVLGISCYRKSKPQASLGAEVAAGKEVRIVVSVEMAAQIKQAEQVLLGRLAAAGVHFSGLSLQHVIEAAVFSLAHGGKETV